MYHRRILLSGVIAALMCCVGCVRLGDRLERQPLPPGAPQLQEVLAGLADSEAALHSFRATGTVMIQVPEVERTQVSRESVLHYQYPDRLYIIGRRYGTRIIELVHADNAFLLEFPTRREYCYQPVEEAFDTISTADIVREMFTPEPWTSLSEHNARIIAYDAAEQTATLEIWEMGRNPWLRRVVSVQGVPWVIRESKLLDRRGDIIAYTVKEAYYEQDGVRYPTRVESAFPGESAWMRFVMRRVDVNIALERDIFDVAGRAADAARRGFRRVDIFAGEGPAIEDIAE